MKQQPVQRCASRKPLAIPQLFTLFVWMSSFVITLANMEEYEDMILYPENMGIHLHINEPGIVTSSPPQHKNTEVEVEEGGFFDFLREMHDEEAAKDIQTTQQRSLVGSKPSPSPTIHPTGPSRTPTSAPTYTPTIR